MTTTGNPQPGSPSEYAEQSPSEHAERSPSEHAERSLSNPAERSPSEHAERSLSEGAQRPRRNADPDESRLIRDRGVSVLRVDSPSARSTTGSTDDPAHALLAANRRRRALRRWIGVASLPLLLVAALFVGKLVSLYVFAYQSITAYVAGDYTGSVHAAENLDPVNWFEPYKAPFNQGVGLAESGKLAAGQKKFEQALTLAHGLEVCAVRINLGIVLEREGDATADKNDHASALEFYAQALEVNAGMPKECDSPQAQQQSPDPQRDMSQSSQDQKDRLQQKQQEQQQQQQNPDQGQSAPQNPPTPDQQKLDELQQKLQQGEQERQQNQQGGTDQGGSSGTDKPW